jgi:predicted butyrate kinase (DUF1464 family)
MIVYPEELLYKRVADLEEQLEKYKTGYEAAMRIVMSTYPDKFADSYFICGELGEKDINNMPKKLMVCPAYGVDFFYVYEYTGETSGPEW